MKISHCSSRSRRRRRSCSSNSIVWFRLECISAAWIASRRIEFNLNRFPLRGNLKVQQKAIVNANWSCSSSYWVCVFACVRVRVWVWHVDWKTANYIHLVHTNTHRPRVCEGIATVMHWNERDPEKLKKKTDVLHLPCKGEIQIPLQCCVAECKSSAHTTCQLLHASKSMHYINFVQIFIIFKLCLIKIYNAK